MSHTKDLVWRSWDSRDGKLKDGDDYDIYESYDYILFFKIITD